MSTEDLGQDSLPMALTGRISSEELKQYLVPRSDLTYRKLDSLTISDMDIHQSLFTGSLIRDCVFTRVTFSRSDFDGLRIEGSTFIECDLSSCDYRSNVFARCRFQKCDFNTSFIDDCEFQECELIDCNFADSSLTHCRFHNSSLTACSLSPGTILHNKLYDSKITDMVLGDCTLLYVILRNCTLAQVSINAESVGSIFGLTQEQLYQADMVYLGEEEPIPPDVDLLSLISEEYRKRNWYIGQLVLDVNFALRSTVGAFDIYLSQSYARFAELGFAKGEELEFLADLLEELAFLERLPLLTVVNLLEWCTTLEAAINQNHPDLSAHALDSLRTLASRTALLTNTLLDKLNSSFSPEEFNENDRSLCVRVTFDEKPSLSLTELLNSVGSAANLNVPQRSRLIRIENGSYVEYVWTTLFTLSAFKVFLYLTNGCLIQITEMRQRARVLLRKNAPKSYIDRAMSPVQPLSPPILTVLHGLIEYSKSLSAIKDSALSGYNATNIKAINEIECPPNDSDASDSKKESH
jgi:uncharacterized protein YjbI with pentapeptide repeats